MHHRKPSTYARALLIAALAAGGMFVRLHVRNPFLTGHHPTLTAFALEMIAAGVVVLATFVFTVVLFVGSARSVR